MFNCYVRQTQHFSKTGRRINATKYMIEKKHKVLDTHKIIDDRHDNGTHDRVNEYDFG